MNQFVRESIINKIFSFLLMCMFVSGCSSNFSEVNQNESINSHDTVYGYDYINRQEEIIKNGYFEDGAGNKFDGYLVSEHFEIYYNDNNQSNKLYASNSIKLLEEEYDRILEFLNVEETKMPIVKIHMYDEYEKIRFSIINELKFDPDSMSNFMGVSIKSDTIYYTLKNRFGHTIDLKRVLVHEFTHIVTMVLTNGNAQVDWVWEGTAKYLAQDKDFSETYYKEMLEKSLPDLHTLNIGENRYIYGYSMVEYIIKTFGREQLIELLVQQGEIDDVLNITEDEFIDGWEEFLEEKLIN